MRRASIPLALVVVLVLIGGALSAEPANPRQMPGWFDLPVLGTPEALSQAADVGVENVEPVLLPLALVRAIYDLEEDPSALLKRLDDYFETLGQIDRFAQVSGGLRISLDPALVDPGHLGRVLGILGYRLTTPRGSPPRVSQAPGRPAETTRRMLVAMGMAERLDDRLNAGEAVSLQVPSFTVPIPLSAETWSGVVLRNATAPRSLLRAILVDARAAMLYCGLAALDPSTLEYLSSTPQLVSTLYDRHAATFCAFGSSLRVREGRVVVPGGDEAVDLWQSVVREAVDRPERFIRAVLGTSSGRLAYLYDIVGMLDPPRARFALGLHQPVSARERRERLEALYSWIGLPDLGWNPTERPFRRPLLDPAFLLGQVKVDATGHPGDPAWLYLWRTVFKSKNMPRRPERELAPRAGLVDAAWLSEFIFGGDLSDRHDNLSTILFAQRVFHAASEADTPNVLVALRGFRRFKALALTLERIGIVSPELYAAGMRRAAQLDGISNRSAATNAILQFQGAVAIVTQASLSQRIHVGQAESLLRALFAIEPRSVSAESAAYGESIALWIDRHVRPTVSATASAGTSSTEERDLVAGLCGLSVMVPVDSPEFEGPIVQWQGWHYRVSPAQALFERTTKIRARQQTLSIDTLLALARTAAALREDHDSLDEIRPLAETLTQIEGELASLPRMPGETQTMEALRARMRKAAEHLGRITALKQIKRARDAGAELGEVTGVLAGHVLPSFVYALALGDPDTPLLLSGDVSSRHAFWQEDRFADARNYVAWDLPAVVSGQNRVWRVAGSLLGLDVALASVSLRTLRPNPLPGRRAWGAAESESFVSIIALFNPFTATSEQAEAIAGALQRGREVVIGPGMDDGELDRRLCEAGVSPVRRRLLPWMRGRDPAAAVRMLSFAELFRLGGGDHIQEDADAWGAPVTVLNRCLCVSIGPAIPWEMFDGRAGTGLVAAWLPDALLRLAELATEIKLPPAIVADVLPMLVRDVLDYAGPAHPGDLMAISRHLQKIGRSEIEEYVSTVSAVSTGHSMIPIVSVPVK